MGNINSSYLDTSQSDPKLLLLLVRYWSSVIETADNISTISRRSGKVKRRSSILDNRKKPIILSPPRKRNKVSRKSSIIVKNGTKLTRNGSIKSLNSSIISRKSSYQKKSLESLNLLNTIPENIDNFDWQTKTYEEIEKMKEIVQWKGLNWVEENVSMSTKSEIKRRFRRKKKIKQKDENWSEMWTLSEKSLISEYDSINLNKDGTVQDENCDDPLRPEKIFWKTSKLSLQDTSILQKIETNIKNTQNSNMLWRSSKALEKFGDGDIEMKDYSKIFDNYTERVPNNSENVKNIESEYDYMGSVKSFKNSDIHVKEIGNLSTLGRKTRLSRWAFLRADKNEGMKSELKNQKKNAKRNSSFRVPQRRYSRRVRNEIAQRNRQGIKQWGLFKNLKGLKSVSKNQPSDESCDCSCCSCDGCQENKSTRSGLDLESLESR